MKVKIVSGEGVPKEGIKGTLQSGPTPWVDNGTFAIFGDTVQDFHVRATKKAAKRLLKDDRAIELYPGDVLQIIK